MSRAAWGIDERELEINSEPISMSRETTFERDLDVVRDKAQLGAIFTRLCERVAEDLQRRGYKGKTVGVKLKFEDFQTATRDHTVDTPLNDAKLLRSLAGLALKRMPLDKRIRLLGVRVGQLVKT